MNKVTTAGFTLIELAAVLFIIAVVVAAILTATELRNSAKIRHVIVEFERIEQAVNNFQDQYHAYPGDMIDAEDIWGTGANGGTTNGDGDGAVETGETVTVFEQLVLAGYLPGTYDNDLGVTPVDKIGVVFPASPFDGFGYRVMHVSNILPPLNQAGLALSMHNEGSDCLCGTDYPFTTEDMEEMDRKMDDGAPYRGKLYGVGAIGTCLNNYGGEYHSYKLEITTPNICGPYYWLTKE